MKRVFLYLTFFYSLSSFGDELPHLIKAFEETQAAGVPKAELECTEADYQACARSLCGDFRKESSEVDKAMQDAVYDERTYGEESKVKGELLKVLTTRQEGNSKVARAFREKLGPKIKNHIEQNWSPRDWDRGAIENYGPYVNVEYKDDQLVIAPKTANHSPEMLKFLVSFSEKLRLFYQRYPNQLHAQGLINDSQFEKLYNESYNSSYNAGDLCASEECQKLVIQGHEKKSFEKLKQFEKINLDPTVINDKAIECLSNHKYYAIFLDRTNKFKALLPEVQKDFLTSGLAGLSEHSRKAFEKYLKGSLHVEFGITSPLTLLKDSKKTDPALLEELLLNQIVESDKDIDPFRKVPACDSQLDVYMGDAFLSVKNATNSGVQSSIVQQKKKDSIFVSQKTCRYHQVGKGIVAHELGHALSNAFMEKKLSEESYKEFLKLRQCATRQSAKGADEPQVVRHEGDKLRTEEDTADLLSFKTYQSAKTPSLCFLMDGGGQYTHVNNGLWENVNNKLPRGSSDPHSTPFVRLLREAIHNKTPLPSSCKKVVEEYREIYEDRETCI